MLRTKSVSATSGFPSWAGVGMRFRVTLFASFAVAVLVLVGSSTGAAASGASAIPLGDYAGADNPGGVAQFGSITDTHPVLATDFLNGSSDWATLDGASGIADWQFSGYRLVLGVPMLPRHARSSLGRGARGVYNSYFVTLARNLVDDGEGNAYLRLGWEFNGTWFKWSVRNPGQAVEYAAYFRNIVTAMRSVPGESFKFVWNPNGGNSHGRSYNASLAYPGSAYVDYIGTDLYDESWVQPQTPTNAWAGQLSEAWGLNWLASFAAAHGKPIVFPEWGVAIRDDGHGLRDDPYFINQFASWITTHDVAWTNMFSYDGGQQDNITDGSFPNALTAFRTDFG
jgi:hypothetical protein